MELIHMERFSTDLHETTIKLIKWFVHVLPNHTTCKEYEPQSPVLSKIIIKCSTFSGTDQLASVSWSISVSCLKFAGRLNCVFFIWPQFKILIVSNLCIWFHSRSLSAFQDSWFKSLFVRKVDPRKDAHSHLLAKKEDSNLYKIQCMCDPCVVILYFIVTYFSLKIH